MDRRKWIVAAAGMAVLPIWWVLRQGGHWDDFDRRSDTVRFWALNPYG
ncbi:hypothetical protein [Streptomyces sp. NPDC059957]